MSQGLVTSQEEFAAVCDEIRAAGIVAIAKQVLGG